MGSTKPSPKLLRTCNWNKLVGRDCGDPLQPTPSLMHVPSNGHRKDSRRLWLAVFAPWLVAHLPLPSMFAVWTPQFRSSYRMTRASR